MTDCLCGSWSELLAADPEVLRSYLKEKVAVPV
jgi:hypothetical protein